MDDVLKVLRSWVKQTSRYVAGRKQWLPLAGQLLAVWLFFALAPVLLVTGRPTATVAVAGIAVAVAVTATVLGMAGRPNGAGADRLVGFISDRSSDESSR